MTPGYSCAQASEGWPGLSVRRRTEFVGCHDADWSKFRTLEIVCVPKTALSDKIRKTPGWLHFLTHMGWLITKYAVTAVVVVVVSELAKRSDKLGGFVAALPLVTILALIWLYVENQPQQKLANHAYYTFWYVIPTLPMFIAFPALLPRLGFWPALLACIILTVVCFGLFAIALRRFGIALY